MPKNLKKVKVDNIVRLIPMPRKFRVGNRESGKSAHGFSTKELISMYADPNKKRYRNNITAVLRSRRAIV